MTSMGPILPLVVLMWFIFNHSFMDRNAVAQGKGLAGVLIASGITQVGSSSTFLR